MKLCAGWLSLSRALKSQVAAVGEMRPVSLVERHRKCGEPNCQYAKRGAHGHWPNWIFTREVKGITVTKAVPVWSGNWICRDPRRFLYRTIAGSAVSVLSIGVIGSRAIQKKMPAK